MAWGNSTQFKKHVLTTYYVQGIVLGVRGGKSITIIILVVIVIVNLAVFGAHNFTCTISFPLKQPYETGIYYYPYLDEAFNL